MKPKTKLVCITGLDGSGKSTLIANVVQRMRVERPGTKMSVVSIWDLFHHPDETGLIFKGATKKQIDAFLQQLSPVPRTLFLYHCLFRALEASLANHPDLCLFDAYWYKYFSAEIANGAILETLEPLNKVFPVPDLTFYLRCDPSVTALRKNQLTGYETGFSQERSKSNFEVFQRKMFGIFERFSAEFKWRTLDGADLPDVIASQVMNGLVTLLSTKPRLSPVADANTPQITR